LVLVLTFPGTSGSYRFIDRLQRYPWLLREIFRQATLSIRIEAATV
jgi:hypothetical protein